MRWSLTEPWRYYSVTRATWRSRPYPDDCGQARDLLQTGTKMEHKKPANATYVGKAKIYFDAG
jgi:hypothetical protein